MAPQLRCFSIGSSIEIEGERAFDPDTVANFGKRDGRYELGPALSDYNIRNVIDIDDHSMGSLNGFEVDFRYLRFPRLLLRFSVEVAAELTKK